MAEELCAWCKTRAVSGAKSDTSRRARDVDLCYQCAMPKGALAKRRKELGIEPKKPGPKRGARKPAPAEGPRCAECKSRAVSRGQSAQALRARGLDLCTRCAGTPGVVAKRRQALGIDAKAVAQGGRDGLLDLLAALGRILDGREVLEEEIGHVLDQIRAGNKVATRDLARLRAKLDAIERLSELTRAKADRAEKELCDRALAFAGLKARTRRVAGLHVDQGGDGKEAS